MKNKRMFVVKYLSSTTHKGTRFKITDTRHRGVSKIFSWDYSTDTRHRGVSKVFSYGFLIDQASTVLSKLGIKIDGFSEPWTEDDKIYLFSDDFSTPLRSE